AGLITAGCFTPAVYTLVENDRRLRLRDGLKAVPYRNGPPKGGQYVLVLSAGSAGSALIVSTSSILSLTAFRVGARGRRCTSRSFSRIRRRRQRDCPSPRPTPPLTPARVYLSSARRHRSPSWRSNRPRSSASALRFWSAPPRRPWHPCR